LVEQLKDNVAAAVSQPFRPREIHFVEALPKTRSMKTMRRVVRAAFLGENPGRPVAVAESRGHCSHRCIEEQRPLNAVLEGSDRLQLIDRPAKGDRRFGMVLSVLRGAVPQQVSFR
jgi:hypothetical protein